MLLTLGQGPVGGEGSSKTKRASWRLGLDRTRGGGAVNARMTRGRGRGVLFLLDAEAEEEGAAA